MDKIFKEKGIYRFCFLWLMVFFITLPMKAYAGSGSCGNGNWTIDEDGVLTLTLKAASTNTELTSEEINGITDNYSKVIISEGYESIADYAFFFNGKVTSVEMADNITSVGPHAFDECFYLKEVAFSSNLTEIGAYAFYNCDELETVSFPESVTKIGEGAFSYCHKLNQVNFSDTSVSLGSQVFRDCTALKSIVIPSAIKQISASCFYHCTELKNVTLSEGLTQISNYAFYQCTKLSSLVLPSTVNQIGMQAFGLCSKLSTIKMHDSLASKVGSTIPTKTTKLYYDCISSAEDSKNPRKELLKKDGGCTEESTYYYECSVCHKKRPTTYTAEATGHVAGNNPTTEFLKTPASCEKPAEYYYQCSKCKIKLEGVYEYGEALGHSEVSEVKPASVNKDGAVIKKCESCGIKLGESKIAKAYIRVAPTAAYTGKAISQSVQIRDIKGKNVSAGFYTIKYKNNVRPGTASVIISFKGNYTGTVTRTFTIAKKSKIPTTVTGLKATAGRKAIKLSWKKSSANADGYEIWYGDDNSFVTGFGKVRVKTLNTTIDKLKANTEYYIRIRAYNYDDGQRLYSEWTKYKGSVKTK